MNKDTPMSDTAVFGPPASPDLLHLLETRRSVAPIHLVAPAPAAEELHRLLTIASRVPDHGRLVPWRFIVIEGEARVAAGSRIAEIHARQTPDAPAGMR